MTPDSNADSRPARQRQVLVRLKNAQSASYAGHRVGAEFQRREMLPGETGAPVTLWVPASSGGALSEAGAAALEFPPHGDVQGTVLFRVFSPDGERLHESEVEAEKLKDVVEFEVDPKGYATTAPNKDPAFGRPMRLRGRVIDRAGRKQVAQRQVVVWGASATEPQAADFRALVVSVTDGNGYFVGPYPAGAFTSAHGTIAIGGSGPVSVPIRLDEEGAFPDSVILVVDLEDAPVIGDEGCDCDKPVDIPRDPDASELTRADGTFSSDPGAGRCVDFTKPDRTLEEFGYTYVVRTTEPTIKGLTLREPTKIDLSRFIHLLPREQFAAVSGSIALRSAAGTATDAAGASANLAASRIDAGILQTLVQDPDGFTLTKVAAAAELTRHSDLMRLIGQHLRLKPGRTRLNCENPVDWEQPTIYQACTIAHGHVLRFKQEWVADGYSMGNLLYSLPLAPGQKKQIAVVDWERRESASRTESLQEREELDAMLSRDRDISEIVNATVSESTRGGSKSSSGSIAGGIGVGAILEPVGGLLGVGGGYSSASSSAWQRSSRNTAASALNQLRDRTVQSASALRSQRSTVVQTMTQGEGVVATTETVANYNHCHAITIQYFEVLRHLLVRQRLADVQECLFVPLLMSRFNSDKALRWRNTLRMAVPLRLRTGFDALERMKNNYVGSDFPVGTYADQTLEHMDGHLYLRFQIARPKDSNDDFDSNAWMFLASLFPSLSPSDFYRQYLKGQSLKDRIFQEQMAPKIAERFVQHLRFLAIDQGGNRVALPIDTTLVSNYTDDRPLYVTLRLAKALPPLVRKNIRAIEISDLSAMLPTLALFQLLPAGSKVIVTSGTLNYRTPYSSGALFRDPHVMNDLVGGDVARIDAPLIRQELRNPREEDKELGRQMLDNLNENIERYHHWLWARMSDDRRYMLLDGFEAPNAGGRSVASVVENELIGIVGNCLVLPVARGFHLDPTFRQDVEEPVDLLEHYQPSTPIEPTRVAIPTRGVYAESVMGACNSCERKEEERFWRWEESPIPDSPAVIQPVSTDSRRAEPPDLTAKDFPPPMINLQNAPAAPDPTGLAAALQLLGNPNLFRDMAGLEGTQKNAVAALQGAFDTAQFFGGKAADLALQAKMARDIDKAMKTIQSAKQAGLLNDEQAQELSKSAIAGMIGNGAEAKTKPMTKDEVKEVADSAGKNKASIKVSRPTGEKVEVDAKEEKKDGAEKQGAEPIEVAAKRTLSILGSPAPGTNVGSTAADAGASVSTLSAGTGALKFNVTRNQLSTRLTQLIANPDAVNQGQLNLCGPATVLRTVLRRDPKLVVKFVAGLVEKGKGWFGRRLVEPGSDLRNQKFQSSWGCPMAEWVAMSSLRDDENWLLDFEGTPDDGLSGATTPGEIEDWLKETDLYSTVRDEANLVVNEDKSHIMGLAQDSNTDNILLIHSHLLRSASAVNKKSDEFILRAFPDHWVVLVGPVSDAGGRVKFDVWSWGSIYTIDVSVATFEANYYGAVIARV